MDKAIALELLASIDRTDLSIRSAARYFGFYRLDAPEIAGLFLNEIANATSSSKKTLLVYVVHEIILSTFDKGDEFIKGFGDRLRMMVDQICGTNDLQSVQSLKDLMQLWENKGFYSKNFMSKMRELLTRKVEAIKTDGKKKDLHSESAKNLAKDYKLTLECDTAKQLYNIRTNESDIQKDMNKLNGVVKLLENKNVANKTEAKIKLKESLPKFEDLAERFKNIINGYMECYKTVAGEAETEFSDWKGFTYDEYDQYAGEVDLLKKKFDLNI